MAQVTITINSREYGIACEDGQEVRIMQLARQMDEKARLITGGTAQINENMLLAMIGLLLADENAELKKNNISQSSATVSVDNSRLLEIDRFTAEKIKSLSTEINYLASQIDLM